MNDIYNRSPINKTAALVTSQSGCASDDTLTLEQQRENLVARVKSISQEILALPKGSQARKDLGKEKADICAQINKLRPKLKGEKGVAEAALDILREEMSEFQFKRLIDRASKRLRAQQNK